MRAYLRLLASVKPYRRDLAIALFCSLLYALFNALAIWFSASFVSAIFSSETAQSTPGAADNLNATLKVWAWQLIGGGDRFSVVQRACGIFFLAFLLRNACNVAQLYFISLIEQRVVKDWRDRVYSHLLSQSLAFFQRRKAGELAAITLNDVSVLAEKLLKTVTFLMREPFVILVFLVLLFAISWKLTLAALLILPLAGALIERLGKSLKRKSLRMQEALANVTSLLYERLGGIRLIKVTGTETTEIQRFSSATGKFFKQALRQRRFDFLTAPLTEVLGLGIISLILLYGGYLVFQTRALDGEDFLRFIAVLFSILAPAKALAEAYNASQVATAMGERIFQILDVDEKLPVAALPQTVQSLEQGIRLTGVSYCYPGVDTPALQEVNLEVQRGATVAIVGPSGAGKTTLIGLIVRLYDPTVGRVTWDGVDLRNLNAANLRRLCGVVSQDVVLFNDSVAANIGYGETAAPREQIQKAAKLAYADEFIRQLPQGYDTQIGDRGARLSGGQQQRLSIARALVHNPPLIIFDEATSQLDSESESLIQKSLETLRQYHTLIVIAHRLATVRRADQIAVLEQGRIIDLGSYEELLQRCELFARLCKQQFLT